MNKKGNTQDNVIMWLGVLTAVIISVTWAIPKIQPYHYELEKINSDIEAIQSRINAACSSIYYRAKYNPYQEEGNLIINNTQVCINNSVSLCRVSLCDTESSLNLDLKNMTYIVIEKNETYNIHAE